VDQPVLSAKYRSLTKIRKIALLSVFLIFVFGILFSLWLTSYAIKKSTEKTVSNVVVMIPRGSSFATVTEILAQAGLVNRDVRFTLLARLYGLSSRIKAGEFSLPTGMKPLELLENLISAKSLQHKITIAEGLNAEEIANIFASQKWCGREEFLELIRNPAFISQFDIGSPASLEGYLYPDTYYLTRIPTLDTKEIIAMMVGRFHQIWQGLTKDSPKDGKAMHETIILASIVEKETAAAEERVRIASVFYNRLKLGMRLQSDPTVIYGIPDFSGNITRKDLRTPSPYNTYLLPGLPAGPICSPGKHSIAAVLYPASEDFLYFVSKNDGTHHFSKNLREHNRAVQRYQRKNDK